jgi:hypothetical protein
MRAKLFDGPLYQWAALRHFPAPQRFMMTVAAYLACIPAPLLRTHIERLLPPDPAGLTSVPVLHIAKIINRYLPEEEHWPKADALHAAGCLPPNILIFPTWRRHA